MTDTKLSAKTLNRHRKMFKVYRYITEGSSVQEACDRAHVKYDNYRRWIIENPESIQVMQKSISAIERVSLMEIQHAASAMLDRILTLTNRDDLPPRTQLEVHSYLSKLTEDLEIKHGTTAREDLRAKEFLLTGPKTKKAEHGTTVNIKPQADGSVDVTVIKAEDIIDMIGTAETPES